jgi:hypothetical protein
LRLPKRPFAHNAASEAARQAVLDYARRFERREDYSPLEDLAQHVQGVVVETAVQVLREEQPAG